MGIQTYDPVFARVFGLVVRAETPVVSYLLERVRLPCGCLPGGNALS
jgi:hypothetical protein